MNEIRDLVLLLKNIALPVAILCVVVVYLWREYRSTRRKLEKLEEELLREKLAQIQRLIEEINHQLVQHRRATE